eukprot:15292307-Heterocapsa_arctica.AAC.1
MLLQLARQRLDRQVTQLILPTSYSPNIPFQIPPAHAVDVGRRTSQPNSSILAPSSSLRLR